MTANTSDPAPAPLGTHDPTPLGTAPHDPAPLGTRDATPRPLLRTVLGGVLRRTRRAQGRTLADVARTAAISVPYLSEVERGLKEASSEVLAALGGALRVPLSDLLDEVGRELTRALAEQARRERLERARELRSLPLHDAEGLRPAQQTQTLDTHLLDPQPFDGQSFDPYVLGGTGALMSAA